jgi:hypothetical protein
MLNSSGIVLVFESSLAVIFFAVMLMLWRKVDIADAALWVLVWATRVFASLSGVQHLPVHPDGHVSIYIALQACSGCTLILIVARSEIRVLKERLVRSVLMRLVDEPVAASGGNA